ncbi:Dihydroorotate dehydrogenase family protein [Sesbania bispinosa]|nr:Dihydroorotate dehydrogenase family protein [Sesbania bispinosa]
MAKEIGFQFEGKKFTQDWIKVENLSKEGVQEVVFGMRQPEKVVSSKMTLHPTLGCAA